MKSAGTVHWSWIGRDVDGLDRVADGFSCFAGGFGVEVDDGGFVRAAAADGAVWDSVEFLDAVVEFVEEPGQLVDHVADLRVQSSQVELGGSLAGVVAACVHRHSQRGS